MIFMTKKFKLMTFGLVFAQTVLLISVAPGNLHAASLSNGTAVLEVDGQQIEVFKRISYKVQRPRRTMVNQGNVDWRYDKPGPFTYRGAVSVSSSSDYLRRLMEKERLFSMRVAIQEAGTENDDMYYLQFDNCKIVEREVHVSQRGKIISTYIFTADKLSTTD